MATLAERVDFLQRYVTFRRTYESLDFDVHYKDNSRGVPAPSDWDFRVVATVPENELAQWIPNGVKAGAAPQTDWLQSVPTPLDLNGINEWYVDGKRWVGLDRDRRIVVYRLFSNPE